MRFPIPRDTWQCRVCIVSLVGLPSLQPPLPTNYHLSCTPSCVCGAVTVLITSGTGASNSRSAHASKTLYSMVMVMYTLWPDVDKEGAPTKPFTPDGKKTHWQSPMRTFRRLRSRWFLDRPAWPARFGASRSKKGGQVARSAPCAPSLSSSTF